MARALKYKDIDLMAAQERRQKPAKEGKASEIRLPALVLVLVLILMGGGYCLLYTNTRAMEEEKESIALYLNDPATQAEYDASLRMQDMAARMAAQKEELGQALINLSSYPDLAGGDFHLIYEYAGERVEVSGVSYDRATGVLSFNAECDTATGVPSFVAQLRMSAIFSDIKYEGYSEQVRTYSEQLASKKVPRVNDVGDPVTNSAGDQVYDEVPQSRTVTEKSFVFAVTALAKAPEPHLPASGESVNGGG